jgi:hypothetical protein
MKSIIEIPIMKTIVYTSHGTSSPGIPCKEKNPIENLKFLWRYSNITSPYTTVASFAVTFLFESRISKAQLSLCLPLKIFYVFITSVNIALFPTLMSIVT